MCPLKREQARRETQQWVMRRLPTADSIVEIGRKSRSWIEVDFTALNRLTRLQRRTIDSIDQLNFRRLFWLNSTPTSNDRLDRPTRSISGSSHHGQDMLIVMRSSASLASAETGIILCQPMPVMQKTTNNMITHVNDDRHHSYTNTKSSFEFYNLSFEF